MCRAPAPASLSVMTPNIERRVPDTSREPYPIKGSRQWSCILPCLCIFSLAWGSPSARVNQAKHSLPPAQLTDIRTLLEAGAREEAERWASEWLASIDSERGGASAEIALALDAYVEALCANGRGAAPKTRKLAERAVHIRRTRSDPPLDLALSEANLADVLVESGLYIEGARQHQRALALREQFEADPADVAASLSRLGRALMLAEQFQQAKQILQRGLEILEPIPGVEAQLATVLERLTAVFLQLGEVKQARASFERARVLRPVSWTEHPDAVLTLNVLGDVEWFEGSLRGAERAYVQALDLAKRRLREDHPTMALTLRNLASASAALGDLPRARDLRERALQLAERTLSPTHPEVAGYLNDLANSLRVDGDYSRARPLRERALHITEQYFGGDNPRPATFLNNLAVLHQSLGDLDSAIRLQTRAIEIWQRHLSADHAFVGRALGILAAMRRDQQQEVVALALYERALTIQKRSLGPTHQEIARTMAELGALLRRMGRTDRADRLLTEAIDMWGLLGAPDDPNLARARAALGLLQMDRAPMPLAHRTLQQALQAHERIFGPSHPETAIVRSHLAEVELALAKRSSALSSTLRAETDGRAHLQLTIRDLPERVALKYAATRPRGLDTALSILATGEATGAEPDRVFDQVVQSRAAVLDEIAGRQRATDNEGPELRQLRASLASARQRLANIVIRGPESMELDRYNALVDRARQQKEEAERALAARSTSFRDELARSRIGWSEIRPQLAAGVALVAFVRYEQRVVETTPLSRDAKGSRGPSAASVTKLRSVPSYLAFVARSDGRGVSVFPLGDAETLDQLIAAWRREVARGVVEPGRSLTEADRAYRAVAGVLRQRIWDPLTPALLGAERVLVVPDGALNVVSLAALPVGPTAFLVEQGPVIHYLSAERDLLLGTGLAHTSGQGLLALGNPAFDDVPLSGNGSNQNVSSAEAAPRREVALRAPASSCGSALTARFQALDATSREVRDLSTLWSDSSTPGHEASRVLLGRDASEGAFKQEAHRYRVLHLATHGFFLGDACSSGLAGTRGVGESATTQREPVAIRSDNPLLLSGLVLAGANRRAAAQQDEDDGILTAEEVASLDLEGVEWAVLSACDTGVGEVKAGEGVFGLRRAFQIAGARTVVMSLWAVDDQSARSWMQSLYEGRLQKRLSTADAIRAASLTVLQGRRSRGESTHPFYWAAFVAAGDWR